MEAFSFSVVSRDRGSRARTGMLTTPHGCVKTPCFMPVATVGTVKTLSAEDLAELGAEMIIANAYHLNQKPGLDIIEGAGGLHRFMNWPAPLVTDSGGFQIFSLENVKVEDDGVTFKSVIDGTTHFITPEKAMEIESRIGADIIMAFDYCPRRWDDRAEVAESVAMTLKWAGRCRKSHDHPRQWLFGIVQGGIHRDLREQCMAGLTALDFPGYAFGGLSIGEPFEETLRTVEFMTGRLPEGKMRYFMGLGMPLQLLAMVEQGVDLFDCGMPTHIARNGSSLTWGGKLNVKAGRHKADFAPIDERCGCTVCRNYSRAYIRHLLNSRELLGLRLNSYHNLYFLMRFMEKIQESIAGGTFAAFKQSFEKEYTNPLRSAECGM